MTRVIFLPPEIDGVLRCLSHRWYTCARYGGRRRSRAVPLLRGINDLGFLLPVQLDTDAGGQGLSIQLSIFASILVANSRSISAPHTEQCNL